MLDFEILLLGHELARNAAARQGRSGVIVCARLWTWLLGMGIFEDWRISFLSQIQGGGLYVAFYSYVSMRVT